MIKPAQRLAMSLDPVWLARYCQIEPDAWQAELLRSEARQILLNCSRQSGKSTITALLAVWNAVFQPSLILIFSPSQRQSGETFRKCKDLLKALDEPIREESVLRVELVNGARLVSLPGKGEMVRGFSKPGLIIMDEAAFVDDALIAAVRPMLAVSSGRMVMLSTPWGQRGAFFEAWENGGTDWQRFKVTADDCPRIARDWLESERRQLGDYFFRSEYLCEFLSTLDSVFRYEDIQRMVSRDVQPLFGSEGEISDEVRLPELTSEAVSPLFLRA